MKAITIIQMCAIAMLMCSCFSFHEVTQVSPDKLKVNAIYRVNLVDSTRLKIKVRSIKEDTVGYIQHGRSRQFMLTDVARLYERKFDGAETIFVATVSLIFIGVCLYEVSQIHIGH